MCIISYEIVLLIFYTVAIGYIYTHLTVVSLLLLTKESVTLLDAEIMDVCVRVHVCMVVCFAAEAWNVAFMSIIPCSINCII